MPVTTLDADQSRAKLETLQVLVHDELAAVNRVILARMQSRVHLIPELARHLIAAGGKRVRPMLTLVAAKLCGYRGQRHIDLAACVEFIHTATLLHDDVVDESDLRRGADTANALWGNKAPVLVGDFLFSRAFQLMVADGDLKVLSILSNASAVIAEGEVAQLLTANDSTTTDAAYMEMITAKTATLFEAATRIGPVIAGLSEDHERALARYGRSLGIAFQLVDDALDYQAEQKALGKTVGDDFADGKVTLPVVLAYARGTERERGFWRRVIEQREQREGDLDYATQLLARYGTIRDTIRRAESFGDEARTALASFGDCAEKRAMIELVDFCIERAY